MLRIRIRADQNHFDLIRIRLQSWIITRFLTVGTKKVLLILLSKDKHLLYFKICYWTDYRLYTIRIQYQVGSGSGQEGPDPHHWFRYRISTWSLEIYFLPVHTHTHCTHHVSDWPEVDTRQSFMECMIAKYVSLLGGRNQGQHAVWLNICKSEHLFPLTVWQPFKIITLQVSIPPSPDSYCLHTQKANVFQKIKTYIIIKT